MGGSSLGISCWIIFLCLAFAFGNEGRFHGSPWERSKESLNPQTIYASSSAGTSRWTTFLDTVNFGHDPNDIDADFDPQFMPKTSSESQGKNRFGFDSSPTDPITNNEENRLPHSPVIYRYYGKRRSRTRASGSTPFILLGPNIDHWRTAGEHLAARGFSVIACERDPLESEGEDENPGSTAYSNWHSDNWWEGEDREGANLISNLLQASRWSKAILVACDSEAVLAIQAAIRLAPEKIAGLVLCGDLTGVDSLLKQSHPDLVQTEKNFAIDAFLKKYLPCQFAIAWDGDSSTSEKAPSEYDGSNPAECLGGHRCFILGGGIAPHRRQPETFAWILTRFVEDKVAPSIPIAEKRKLFRRVRKERKEGEETSPLPGLPKGLKRLLSHSVFSGDFFSSGSFVVYGRIIASALAYGSFLKVAIYQYGNFLDGAATMKTRYDLLRSLKGKIVAMISGFFRNYGYLPLLFRGAAPEPELDPVDFVTTLDIDGFDELTPGPEDQDKHAEAENRDSTEGDATKEKDGPKGSTYSTEEGSNEKDSESKDNDAEKSKEKEQRQPYPLFFLDRVVAMDRMSDEIQHRS